ncbi:MAG TPA: PAS domain S-box protein [Phycisphaerae bacterium]|nr:PAS domain S-box protein [Phycisphaerae bacterium]
MEEYVWLTKSADHPLLVRQVHPVLRRLGEQHGLAVALAGPDDGDLEALVAAARDAIDRGVAGVMLMGWEHPRILAAANAIVEAGIGLITVETRVPRHRGLAHVGTDWFRLGGAMGDRAAVLVGRKGKVLLLGKDDLGHPSVGFRGFLLRMGFNPGIQLLGPFGRGEMPAGDPEPILRQHLDEHADLAAIVCLDADSSRKAARLLVETGRRGSVRLLAVDPDDELIEHVRSGTIDICFGRKLGASAFLAFQMLYAYRHGSAATAGRSGLINIPGNIDTGSFVVTGENADTYVHELDLDEAFERHKLSQQLMLFSNMIQNTGEIALAADTNGRVVYANPATSRLTGLAAAQVRERSLQELFALSVADQMAFGVCAEKGIPHSFESAVRGQEAPDVPVQVSISPLRTEGVVRGVVVVAVELADRKRAEEALRESEERFRLISEQSLMGIGILQDGRIQYANQAAADILEYSVEDILHWQEGEFAKIIHPDDAPFVLEQGRRKQAGEADVNPHYAYRMITGSGRVKWIEQYSRTVSYKGGPADLATFVDITDRMEAQEAHRRLAAAVEHAGEMIVVTDTEGRIEYVNPAFEKITGYRRQEAQGRDVNLLLSAGQPDEAQVADLWATIRQGRTWTGRFASTREDGREFESEATISPVRDAAGNIVSFVSVERDVTQEAALEAQLRHAQKMEAVGHLAGGIAHDFNNLLTAILGNAQLLKMQYGTEGEWAEALEGIIKASRRAADLTRQLLAFARKGRFRNVVVDVRQSIEDVAALLSRSIDKQVEIRRELADAPLTVLGDPTELQNAVMNLAINACDAMPGGGVMTLAARAVELGEGDAGGVLGDLRPGRYVELAVRDTGTGIDPKVRPHIFEPFFTTKEAGRGTGLGLASVYGCVRSHGGDLCVESTPGRGTTFRLLLPLVEADPEPDPPAGPAVPLARGTGGVLLVDDEDTVRQFARSALEKLGYTVLAASNGREALRIYRRERDRIRLVILDLIMPGLSGRDTLRRLREIDPAVPVIIASGDPTALAGDGEEDGALAYLHKPFDVSELSATLARHLGPGPAEDGVAP